MNKILDVVEDIKQNITDNQYKTIMDSLMEINKINTLPLLSNNQERNEFVCLFNWIDSKLVITEFESDSIRKMCLQKYIITNFLIIKAIITLKIILYNSLLIVYKTDI